MDDHRAIENLLYRYAERIDAGDFEGVAELFRHATIIAASGQHRIEGYEAVLAMYRGFTRLYDDGTPRTQHIVSNARIEVDGDNALAHSRFTVLQATDALALQPIIAGRYEDRFHRVDGAWRFAERAMIPTLYGDVSQHLLQRPEAG
ncbi:nuclear transport factor 2 family protein [Algiphilus aromaticivorans]|uniref:nuclear transport factor 2 family protein n=1 Tax=Algiphilus aromaticivorans TaxID=382454 RepID=UPI0005C1F1FE|nr:nuclear transport factor 2 family protein [Algiphilus aromaticivorans]